MLCGVEGKKQDGNIKSLAVPGFFPVYLEWVVWREQ